MSGAYDVGNAGVTGGKHDGARDVAKRERAAFLVVGDEHEDVAPRVEAAKRLGGRLRRGSLEIRGVENPNAPPARVHAERGPQRPPPRLAVDLHRVAARSGAEGHAPTRPMGGAN